VQTNVELLTGEISQLSDDKTQLEVCIWHLRTFFVAFFSFANLFIMFSLCSERGFWQQINSPFQSVFDVHMVSQSAEAADGQRRSRARQGMLFDESTQY
jgi:hypothetical protein